jgi:3-hydroxybutyryl-CoA dehydratase
MATPSLWATGIHLRTAAGVFNPVIYMLTRQFTVVGGGFGGMAVATVGDTATAELEVTRDDVERFAALTGDDNPLHVDPEYAAESVFGEPVAHGMLTASAVSAALAELPGDVVYVSQDLEFTRPVTPGETLTAEVEVVEQLGDDRLRVRTTAATDREPAVEGEAIVMSLPHG